MKQETLQCRSKIGRAIIPGMFAVLLGQSVHAGFAHFNYAPITEPITSAVFSVDFAALVAHRTAFGEEVNRLRLIDPTGGPAADLSDGLFGTAVWPAPADFQMGAEGEPRYVIQSLAPITLGLANYT